MIIGLMCCDQTASFAQTDKAELPWLGKDSDLDWFRYVTNKHIVLVGTKTAATLPELKNREVWVMSSQSELNSAEAVLKKYAAEGDGRNLFVCGGEKVWEAFRNHYDIFYVTFLREQYVPDGEQRKWLPTPDSRCYSSVVINKNYSVTMVLREDIKKTLT